jgi:hypothetical protein
MLVPNMKRVKSKPIPSQKSMKKIAFFLVTMSLYWGALAQHSKKEVEQDIARHRAMAEAHEAAAKCLESGKKPEQCTKELQTACRGLALGKYCGMKHVH